jgi:methionyl-tRNA synthetase
VNCLTKVSKESGKPVVWTAEENYKFKLSHFQPLVLEWLLKNPKCIHSLILVITPKYQYETIISQLQKPLGDLSISRLKSRVSWGIEVPNDPTHVIYVWLDALVNYLTVSGYPINTTDSHVNIIGKDILK